MLGMKFDKNLSSCIGEWPEAWMGKAYSMTWFLVFGVLPILIMVALYSTVVYNLWFKSQEDSALSFQQMVRLRSITFRTWNLVIPYCCCQEDGKKIYQNVKRTCRATALLILILIFKNLLFLTFSLPIHVAYSRMNSLVKFSTNSN